MARIFLIVSIVMSIGSAVMAFLTKGDLKKVEEGQERVVKKARSVDTELGRTVELLDQTKGELAASQKLAEDRQESITGLNKQLTGAKDEVSKTKQGKAEVEKMLADAEGTVEKAKKDIEKVQGLEKELADLKASSMAAVEAKDREIKTLNDLVEAAKRGEGVKVQKGGGVDLLAGGTEGVRERKVTRKPGPKEGEVVSYDSSWNFAVVSIGDRSGITPETVLYAMRGSSAVAKLKVTKVYADQAVVLPEDFEALGQAGRVEDRAREGTFRERMSKAFAPKSTGQLASSIRVGDRVVIGDGQEKKNERAAAVAEAKNAAANPVPAMVPAAAPKAEGVDPLLAIPGIPGLPTDEKPGAKPGAGDSKDAPPDPFKLNFN